MAFKKILNNLYLGDQFSNKVDANFQLKISNIYYDILLNQKEEQIEYCNKDNFVKTKTKLAINLLDSHSERDFNNILFASAIKFIEENVNKNYIYTHCQLGVSRSSSVIFVYLVIKG
ncbi:dual specificity protein phosphatase family protein [Spiroplasma endosymbiont of Atherix ibis]|uniref:dual specificity protein phosphatase family protein n=1 Tax=Spiroplasma endosymbiont of Atherix ibis TaxID=3066291 RepID=UPI0030D137C1